MNYHTGIFSEYLSDPEMAVIVSDETMIKKMLQFEIALVNAQSKLAIIPSETANEIRTVLSKLKIPPSDLSAGTLQNGIPVITLLSLAKEKLSTEGKKYLHFGSTSQDVMDTAQVLIIRDALVIIEEKIKSVITGITQLLQQYGDTPCMARTRGQLAMPITFGLKLNAWLQPLKRQLQRLKEISSGILQVQLGGAAGDLSAFKDKGEALMKELANELKLFPAASWHTQRDNIGEFTNWLAMLTGILGKMGADILIMAQSEVDEIVENADGGKSSAMPHKNNPVLSEALVAIARINAGLQSQVLVSMIHANERDATSWILEWNAIPQMLLNCAASLNHTLIIAKKMKVNTEQMKNNVEQFLKNNSGI